MPLEITAAGGSAEAVMNLRRGKVNNLRGTARAPESKQVLSVAELKKGGDLDLGGLLEAWGAGEQERSLRQRAGDGPKASARQSRSESLSLPERLKKLAQIKKSATEYEALFVDQLVKLMRPSPLTRTPGQETLSELAEGPFRDFLSQAGGLGLANTIVGQIARQEGLEQTLHEHPEIMGPGWRPQIAGSIGPKLGTRLTLPPAGLEPQAPEPVLGALSRPPEPA